MFSLNSYKKARVLLNRSMSYLKLELFGYALSDAREALKCDNVDKEKAFYRQAKAEYAMRKFADSIASFEKCLAANSTNKEALIGLSNAKQRVHESQTGEYDFAYLAKHCEESTLRFDLADYVSDLIRIQSISSKSKGVRAVKNIEKGTLLVVSKAASIVNEQELADVFIIGADMCIKRMDIQLGCTIHAMQGNPDMAKEIYKLYTGKQTVN